MRCTFLIAFSIKFKSVSMGKTVSVRLLPIDRAIKNPSTIFFIVTLVMVMALLFSRSVNRLKLYEKLNPKTYLAPTEVEIKEEINALYANPLLDEPVQPTEPFINSYGGFEETASTIDKKDPPKERRVHSINDLMDHIKNDSLHLLDFDYLVNFINESDGAFQVVVNEFQYTDNELRKSLLLQLIDNVHREEKVDFAFVLVRSNNESERLKALRWMSHSKNQYDTAIVSAFADALDAQENEGVLSDVMDFLVVPTEENNPSLRSRVISRLGDLANHSDDVIAEKALNRLIYESLTHSTEALVISKLSSQSETMQLAAINALDKFVKPNALALEKLNELVSDPYASQRVKTSAVRASVALENKLNIRELY